MINKVLTIKKENLVCIFLFLYFVILSSFRLTYGIDSQLGKISLGLLFIVFVVVIKKIKINMLNKWLFLFWGWYFLSTLWSMNIADTSYCLVSSIKVILLSLIISTLINNKNDVDKLFKLLILSLIISMIVLFIKTPLSTWGTERVGYSIGLNPNALGLRYSMGVIMCFYYFNSIKSDFNIKIGKKIFLLIILVIAMLLFSLVILYSGSKKALFCLVFGLLFYIFVTTKGIKKYFKFIIFVVFLVFMWNFIKNNNEFYKVIGSRIEDYINYTFYNKISKYDVSSIERDFFREEAFNLFKSNWLFGVGGNGFVTHMRNIGHSHVAYCHNNYLELLCTLGIIGFSIFYSFIFKIVCNLYKKIKNNQFNVMLLALVICMLISDYGGVSYYEQFNMILLSIIYSYIFISRKEDIV